MSKFILFILNNFCMNIFFISLILFLLNVQIKQIFMHISIGFTNYKYITLNMIFID